MAPAASKAGTQRVITLVLLIGVGLISFPVVAAFLDGESTERLILPAQLAVMAAVAAAVGYLVPGLAGASASSGRSAALGALVGVVAGLVSSALFFFLLGGSGGG